MLTGLLSVWKNDFRGAETAAVLPYEPYLKRFPGRPLRIGIAADHGGYELKTRLMMQLLGAGYDVLDFGNSWYRHLRQWRGRLYRRQ